MASADAKDLPMHQKWCTYLSSKENRNQNKNKTKQTTKNKDLHIALYKTSLTNSLGADMNHITG